jgi:hypothetical protein
VPSGGPTKVILGGCRRRTSAVWKLTYGLLPLARHLLLVARLCCWRVNDPQDGVHKP